MLQQAFNGLVGGSFYALLALGLAVIFGMLGVVNLAHGAFYMLGAFGAFIALDAFGLNFWVALVLVPLLLGVVGAVLERLFVRRLTPLDPLYNFLFTFGLALILQDLVRREYGVNSQPYPRPPELAGDGRPGAVHLPGLPGVRAGGVGADVRRGVGGAHQDPGGHDRPGRDRAA